MPRRSEGHESAMIVVALRRPAAQDRHRLPKI
jgi:hypothetical protein